MGTVVLTPGDHPVTEYRGEDIAKGKKKAFDWGGFICTRYTLPEKGPLLLKKVRFYISDYTKDSLVLRLSVNPPVGGDASGIPDVSKTW